MTEVELTHALGGWPAGQLSTPTDGPSPSEVTLLQTVNGAASQRVFPVATSVYGRAYERTAASQSWTETLEPPADLETVIDEELLFLDELPNGWGSLELGTINPLPLELELGQHPGGGGSCPVKPTYLEVAQRALDYLGADLVILDGPGLILDHRVPYDYTTKGKTVQAVLDETIFATNPRWWGDGLTVYVDGRELTPGTLATVAGIETLTTRVQRGAVIPEPSPPAGEPDPGQGTFETHESGTFTWTEAAGAGEEYTETTYTVTKANGQLTEEREVRQAYVPSLAGPVWATVYDSLTTREYHPACGEAMVREVQVVNAARTDITYWNLDLVNVAWGVTILPVEDFVPPMYMTLHKTIRQSWHAEGWLRSREEVTLEPGAYWINARGEVWGEIAYRRTSRTEYNLPVGNGLWLTRVTEYVPSEAPVWVAPEGGVVASEATYPVAGVNTFTRISDSPPPTVSCPADPCRVEETPAERYARELAVREAMLVNDPDREVVTLTLKHLALEWSVGDTVDGYVVTRITRNVASDNLSCEVELWGAHGG